MARALDLTPRDVRAVVRQLVTRDYEPYVTQGSMASEATPYGWWLFRASDSEDAARHAQSARAAGLDKARAHFLGHWLVLLRPVSQEDLHSQDAARTRQRERLRAQAEAEDED